MSRKIITPSNDNNELHARYLSSNHKVMQYLQNTKCSSTTNNNGNPFNLQRKTSGLRDNGYYEKDTSMNNNCNQYNQRMRSCSENNSILSDTDQLSRTDYSISSCLSDPGGHRSILSSNTSSSGICSTFSDVSPEENAFSPQEDLDFNLGSDQINNTDEIEVDDLDEADEYEHAKEDKKRISNKNNDAATLLGPGESSLDTRINELEGFFRKFNSSTSLNSNPEYNNDGSTTTNNTKEKQNLSLLRDSTSTLCSQDLFTAYAEDRNNHGNNNDDDMENAIVKRSNSVGIVLTNRKQVLVDKPPKKVVRFADMMGLDLESIRYMTPPDQTATLMTYESIRTKLDQLRQAKSLCSSLSSSPSPFDLPSVFNRSSSFDSLKTARNATHRYYLVSKYFTSPTDVIPLVYDRQIILECLYTNDTTAYGTVRVNNFSFEKRVFVRFTEDEWKTHQDVYGWHSMNYQNNNTDTFTFEIRLKKYDDPSKVPKQIYFAACLQVGNREYWDNNLGWNYVLDVLERR